MKNLLYKYLWAYKDEGLLIIRVLIGISLASHGYAKFAGGETTLVATGSMLKYFGISGGYLALGTLAALAELLGGCLTALGLFTRIATFFAVGVLFVAMTVMFISAGFNAGGHAMDDMIIYIGIFIMGPGRYSLDYKMAPPEYKEK